jgi:hypothetical protein
MAGSSSRPWAALIGLAIAFVLDGIVLPEIEAGMSVFSVGGLGTLNPAFGALNAGISGGASGAETTGRLKGALMGALEAEAFFATGSALGDDKTGIQIFRSHTAAVVLAHGMVGGLFSIGQKGGFQNGFLAADMGSLADAPELDAGPIGNYVTHAVAGGLDSMLGGGKFLNGAITAAFEYLFNDCAHATGCLQPAHETFFSRMLDELSDDFDPTGGMFGVGPGGGLGWLPTLGAEAAEERALAAGLDDLALSAKKLECCEMLLPVKVTSGWEPRRLTCPTSSEGLGWTRLQNYKRRILGKRRWASALQATCI